MTRAEIIPPVILYAATLVVVAACAGTPDRPMPEYVAAETAISQAEDLGAQQHSRLRLDEARMKLRQARAEEEDGDELRASQLAAEAELDARVAIAQTNAAESEAAALELEQSLQTLESELERNAFQ